MSADVVPAAIAAAANSGNTVTGRVILIELLRRIFVRESDHRILNGLETMALDREKSVRKSVIRALGDIGQTRQLIWLIEHLATESDEDVLREALLSIQSLGEWKLVRYAETFWVTGGAELSTEQSNTRRPTQ